MPTQYDLAVVGLGIYGTSLAAGAASSGLKVLAVDQFHIQNPNNSSHGSSRIFRFTTLEDSSYALRARRSAELWSRLDAVADKPLLSRVGFALIAHGNVTQQRHHGVSDVMSKAKKIAAQHDVRHEVMTGREMMRLYPDLILNQTDDVFYENDAFVIHADRAIATLADICRSSGLVDIVVGAKARVMKNGPTSYVDINGEAFSAAQIAVCCGPWPQFEILGQEVVPVRVVPQVTVEVPFARSTDGWDLPAFAHLKREARLVYSVPPIQNASNAKFGIEQGTFFVRVPAKESVPESFVSDLLEEAITRMWELAPNADVTNSVADVCFYATTEGGSHRIQAVGSNVTVFSCCSGHGFKYAPAIAEEFVYRIIS